MPMRAWEFALGGSLMLAAPVIERWPTFVRALLFVAGVVLIGVATVTLDNTVAYPGTAVLLPTLGTVALIAAGCGPGFAPLQRWLASGGMVAIGQLSYSWYLWHWPLLSLARTNDLGERYLARDGTIALVSLGLAWLTYRFIEHPIRSQQYRGFRSTRATLLSGAAMSAVVLCCALGLGLIAQYFYAHPLDRQQKLTADAVYDRPASTAACLEKQHSTFAALARDRRCFTQPSQPVELVLWGDSHANHWFPLMRQASRELHMNVEEFARASCPPLLGVMPFNEGSVDRQCERFNQAVIAEIERLARGGELKGVVLAGRWPAYLGRPSPDGSLLARLSYGDGPLDPAKSEEALHVGLEATLGHLEHAGLRVVVVGATPEFRYSVPQCLLRRSLQECAMPRAAVDARRGRAMHVVSETVASNGGAHMYDPLRFFCDEDYCYPTHGQTVMFSDPQHLTAAGAPLLEPELDRDLRWMLQ
jgi:hypothetical protein